jgi:hypothetical protein
VSCSEVNFQDHRLGLMLRAARSNLQTRCCVLMLDLDDAEDLVCDMFRLCFLIIK